MGFFWVLVFLGSISLVWGRNFERREVEVHFLWFLVFYGGFSISETIVLIFGKVFDQRYEHLSVRAARMALGCV